MMRCDKSIYGNERYLRGMFRLCSALLRTLKTNVSHFVWIHLFALTSWQEWLDVWVNIAIVWCWGGWIIRRHFQRCWWIITSKPNLSRKFRSYCSNGWLAVNSCKWWWFSLLLIMTMIIMMMMMMMICHYWWRWWSWRWKPGGHQILEVSDQASKRGPHLQMMIWIDTQI